MAHRDRDREDNRRRGYGDTGADYDFGPPASGHGAIGNYLGDGGYGTMRDYESYRGIGEAFDDRSPRESYRGRGPKGFVRSDERLRELVSERLEDHHDIDASDIEVMVSGCEVTLTGRVDSRRTKRLAEDVVSDVPGVKDVHNQLTIDHGFFERK